MGGPEIGLCMRRERGTGGRTTQLRTGDEHADPLLAPSDHGVCPSFGAKMAVAAWDCAGVGFRGGCVEAGRHCTVARSGAAELHSINCENGCCRHQKNISWPPGLVQHGLFWGSGVQAMVRWRSPLSRWHSRKLLESTIRAVQCYDCLCKQPLKGSTAASAHGHWV